MKNIFITGVLTLITLMSNAQSSNVILFTENGEKFYAILNGVRQNDKPETNVKITELNTNFYKLKVIFDDTKLGEKNFNLAFNPGTETTYSIKYNAKKNDYVLRPVSEVPMAEALPPAPNQSIVVYNATPTPGGTTVTQTTTTTTTGGTTAPGDNVNVNVGFNVNDAGGGFNMNVSGGTTQTTSQTTTTTVTHSTTSTPPPPAPAPAYLPGYNGPYGCPAPMAPQDFAALKQTISSKSFEDSKMTIAKQVLKNNCLFTSQVKELMGLFTFEETKLDFAKYAYSYTYDIGNYFKVNDMFTFESSIDDLNNYINSRR